MANVTTRRTGELIRALFCILQKYPDGIKAQDALEKLADTVILTEYEKGTYESGGRFEKIVRFATLGPGRAGWMIKDSGIWSVTEEGIAALEMWPDPSDFSREAGRLYREWHKTRKTVPVIPEKEDSNENEIDELEDGRSSIVTFEESEEKAFSDIEKYLADIPPFDFQHLVADLLRAMKYFVEWVAPPGKDGGVDIMAYTDPLGTQGSRIKVQVKRQQQAVGAPDLRSFVANIGQHDAGIFVNIGGFTREAEEYARALETKRIMLINVKKLVKLWIQFISNSDPAWQRLPLMPIYFLKLQG